VEYRHLGRSGLRVSVLTMGTTSFTGGAQSVFGSTDLAEAQRLVDICTEAGVNLIDTSDAYSAGIAESIVGEVLAHNHDMLVATKVRFSTGSGPNDEGLSRHHVLEAAEASLRRLKRDHIDIYLMHGWDGSTPIEETLAALNLLVESGKVALGS
jgi:aryl-alcohol dehydrogenase-like predicted oxidoreductase